MTAHSPEPKLNPATPDHVRRLAVIVGADHMLTDADRQAPYLREWRNTWFGRTAAVLRPGSTDEISRILALANAERIGIVPQGGNTGLVGGQIPYETGGEIVLSLTRLNRIRHIDPAGTHMIVEAGLTLKAAQDAAEGAGRLFPLSLGAEGTCQIGGNLATNAGGVAVLAYGSARHLTLGLEVVLADGRVWDGLRALKKDNAGYDLKDLFIGSEGTLGIITAASLKLFPRPAETAIAFAALENLEDVRALLDLAHSKAGTALTAFEFISERALSFVLRHIAGTRAPRSGPAPWYVLMEISGGSADGWAASVLQSLLERATADRLVRDAAIAASLAQSRDFWRLRETIPEAQMPEGASIKHDISVPIAAIPEFVVHANAAVESICPGARPVPFGHFGDGNVHYNVSQPPEMAREAFAAIKDQVTAAVHRLALDLGGSISAEHGIGRMKRAELARIKSDVELSLMRRVKSALDPNGILNPGKVL